jgi:hypothetical protein
VAADADCRFVLMWPAGTRPAVSATPGSRRALFSVFIQVAFKMLKVVVVDDLDRSGWSECAYPIFSTSSKLFYSSFQKQSLF